jgi:hypothetical protein
MNVRWSMNYWSACEHDFLGSTLALSFSATANAQEKPSAGQRTTLNTGKSGKQRCSIEQYNPGPLLQLISDSL